MTLWGHIGEWRPSNYFFFFFLSPFHTGAAQFPGMASLFPLVCVLVSIPKPISQIACPLQLAVLVITETISPFFSL